MPGQPQLFRVWAETPHQLVAGVGADDVLGCQLHCHLVRQFWGQAAFAVDFGQLPQLPALRFGACGAVRTGAWRSEAAVVALARSAVGSGRQLMHCKWWPCAAACHLFGDEVMCRAQQVGAGTQGAAVWVGGGNFGQAVAALALGVSASTVWGPARARSAATARRSATRGSGSSSSVVGSNAVSSSAAPFSCSAISR